MHVQFCLEAFVGRTTHGIEPVYMVHTVMQWWFFFFSVICWKSLISINASESLYIVQRACGICVTLFFMYIITIFILLADWSFWFELQRFSVVARVPKMGMKRYFKEKFECMFEKEACFSLEQTRLNGSVSCSLLFYLFCSCYEDQSFFKCISMIASQL